MPKTPECYGDFMANIGNPNCDNCWCRTGCYQKWSNGDKHKKKLEEEMAKPWAKQKPLSELFPELCEKCEVKEE